MSARPRIALLCALLAGAGSMPARAAPADAEREYAARKAALVLKDAEDLRRLAEWGDRNGLERTADVDWQRAHELDPANEPALRRLRFVRRGAAWLRDEPSWVLARMSPDARPDRLPEYLARRRDEVIRPAVARRRELAAWCRDAGLAQAAQRELLAALALDPADPWAHLALGETFDPDEGWTSAEVRARRIADSLAGAVLDRLATLRAEAIRQEGDGPSTQALGFPTTLWRLREWSLETDLPDDDAAQAIAMVDLGARWFRDFFGLPVSEKVLPFGASFLVLSTNERYLKAIAAETRFSKAERDFARGLGGMPVDHTGRPEPWHAIFERPGGVSAADAALHFAVHFLMEARFAVGSREAWLYEGLAAYAVFRIAKTNDTWCVNLEETSAKVSALEAPDAAQWAEVAASLVARHDDFPLQGLLGASLNGLDGPMLVKAWSLLRFLLEEHPEDARRFLELRAAGLESDRALKEATGLRVDDIDEAWRRHVIATKGE